MPDSANSNRHDKQPNDPKASNLIRQKLANIYSTEPDTKIEAAEAEATKAPSKHQKFMQELVEAGKDIASIQTEWHNYYLGLSEKDKLQVWDEFYASNRNLPHKTEASPASQQRLGELKNEVKSPSQFKPKTRAQLERVERAGRSPKAKLKSAPAKLTAKHHAQSLLFGLSLGFIVVVIFLFGFFNEVFIAPFIQPSRNVSVPVIIGESTVAPTTTPEVIIPKINVEIPVNYSETSTDESVIENDLQDGVVHYPTTVLPGQLGNAAFFGHSSNNIFNPGKYKFAFVLLHTLVNGDTFYLTYNHTVYVYKVISHTIVSPNDVSVLGSVSGQTATATLITCDPPGTSINRLIVVGQQISPSPSTDTQPVATTSPTLSTKTLPGNGPTLWSRFFDSKYGKIILVLLAMIVVIVAFRRSSKKELY